MNVVIRNSFLIMLFFSGCVSSFDRQAAENRLESIPPDNFSQASSILKMPMIVAVFADMETLEPSGIFEETWDWSNGDRNLIVSYLDKLEELRYISGYFIIPDRAGLRMQDIGQLMEEAKSQNADVLLTVRGVIQVNSYLNPAAILNLTILGGWLFPGSNRDVMLTVHMNMWNVKEKGCEITVKGEGFKKISEPTFLIDSQDAVDLVKRDTLRKVLSDFKKRCREIKPAK